MTRQSNHRGRSVCCLYLVHCWMMAAVCALGLLLLAYSYRPIILTSSSTSKEALFESRVRTVTFIVSIKFWSDEIGRPRQPRNRSTDQGSWKQNYSVSKRLPATNEDRSKYIMWFNGTNEDSSVTSPKYTICNNSNKRNKNTGPSKILPSPTLRLVSNPHFLFASHSKL